MKSTLKHILLLSMVVGVWAILASSNTALADDSRNWQIRSPMPTARTGVSAVVLNGQVYVMGGMDAQGKVLDVVERYDPQNDTWHPAPALRTARVNAAAVVYNGDIVLVGGRDSLGAALKKVEIFVAAENDWNSFDNMEEEREGPAIVVLENELYVMGGSNLNENILDSVEYYDLDEERWENSEDWDLDVPRASYSSITIGNVAYSIGGFSSFGPIGLVQRYHLTQGTTNLASLSPARGGLAAAVLENSIYAMGGRGGTNQVVATVNRFLPDQNRWESAPAMKTPRERFAAVSVGGDIFVFGGSTSSGTVLGSVEAFVTTVAPNASNDVLITDEDVEMSINVLVNDSDPAGGSLSISSFSQPTHGTVELINANTLSFSPEPNYFGNDSFTYTAVNSTGGTAQATVEVTVQAVNDPPWFSSSPVTGISENERYSYEITAGDVENDNLVFEPVSIPAWLTLTDRNDGSAFLEGTPDASQLGSHSVSLAVTDGETRIEQAFTIEVVSGVPNESTLLSPSDGSMDLAWVLTLSWNGLGASTFNLQVALDEAFTNLVVDESGIEETSFEIEGLEPLTVYYWRVQGANAAGAGLWSNPFQFQTALDTSNEGETPLTPLVLHPNYPNPFRDITTIEFEVPHGNPGAVRLDIFDLQGRRIITLAEGVHMPGQYSVRWEGIDAVGQPVASGAYLLRLQHGTAQHTRPLMLIR